MKKILISLMFFSTPCMAGIIDHVQENTKFTALDGVAVGSFQSFSQGTDFASQGSLTSHVFTYKDILTLDFSWAYAFTGTRDGTGLGGPGLKVKDLITKLFPTLNLTNPTGNAYVDKIINSSFVNYSIGWRTENGAFDHGPILGLEARF